MFKILQAKDSTSHTVQIINAVNNSWPVLLIIIITVIFIIYRKKIGTYLSRFNKVSGKTPLMEVNLEREQVTTVLTQLSSQENEPSDQLKNDNVEKEASKLEEVSFYEVYLEITKGKLTEADGLFQQIQEKVSDPIEKEKNYLFLLNLKHLYSATNKISEIEKIAETATNQEIKSKAFKYLGECYSKGKEFTFALDNYKKAFSFVLDEEEKSSIALSIAETLSESGKKFEAIEYLKNIKETFPSKVIKAKLFAALSEYYEDDENWIEQCLALELAVANDPNNTTNLFHAGYTYSNSHKNNSNKFAALALLHYKDLISYKPDSVGALNNIGVAYTDLNLIHKSTEAFKRAIELKHTLASANLANKYINIGCFEEAVTLLNSVKDYENVHENVWSALKRIKENEKEENEKEDELIRDAKHTQIYLREFAQIYFSNSANILGNIDGNWKINGTNVEYKQLPNPDYFEFKWTESGNKFTITLNTKKSNAILGDGEYIKPDRYSADKLSVFSIVTISSLRLLLYDKSESISFQFNMIKE